MKTNDNDGDSVTPLPEDATHKSTVVSSAIIDSAPDDLLNPGHAAKVARIVVDITNSFSRGPAANPISGLVQIKAVFSPTIFPDTTFGLLTKDLLGIMYPDIDLNLLSVVVSSATRTFRTHNLAFDNITIDFQTWKDTPDSVEGKLAKKDLGTAFSELRKNFMVDILNDFTRAEVAGSLIPQYVASASRYLATLIAYYKHAPELGLALDFPSSSKTVQEIILEQFRKDLATLTNQATKSYSDGLKKIISGSTRYPRTWDDYTEYRNLITITGLDLLTHLQCIDPLLYPHGYHANNLTRKLVSFLGTDLRAGAVRRRGNILEIEAKFNELKPVMSLYHFMFSGVDFKADGVQYRGLHLSQCWLKSIDGYELKKTQPINGNLDMYNIPTKTWEFDLENNCFAMSGRHWNVAAKNTPLTITDLIFYFHQPSSYMVYHRKYHFVPKDDPGPQDHFVKAIPVDGPLNSVRMFTERLANFEIIFDPKDHTQSYLFSWHHRTGLIPLLPQYGHAWTMESSAIEQLHAIKAASSIIDNDRLRIIAGPGFTGGDLVELNGGASVSFKLNQGNRQLFAGAYKVRLWYIPHSVPGAGVYISFRVTATNHITSETTVEIMGVTPAPDLKKIQHKDLQSIEFLSTVLIVRTMHEITITLRNIGLSLPVIVDRVELIFDHYASDPIAVASSDISN